MGTSRKQRQEKICAVCGKVFSTAREIQVTCSAECGRIYNREAMQARKQKFQEEITNPFRLVTPTTELLVRLYRDDDHLNAEQIAKELRRDVSVIEKILAKLERQEKA